MKKIVALLLCLTIGFTAVFTGCSGESDIVIDETKYQLRVSHYNGGVGHAWLDSAIKRFEEAHKNDKFSNNRTGVQVIAQNDKQHRANSVETASYDIIIDQNVPYIDQASKNNLLDLTDVVKDTSDGTSIESRMTDRQKSALTTINDKYYVIPHYEYFPGLAYDVNVFEDYNLYFAENGGFITSMDDTKSVGPDGEEGTYDDGLPATYEEFFDLMDEMVSQNVTPFVWSDQYQYYVHSILFGLLSAYSGKEELETLVTLDSGENTIRVINEFSGSEPVIEDVQVTKATGYETSKLAGKYYALTFLEKILSNKNYYYNATGGRSNTEAQDLFIDGYVNGGNSAIGFLVEGNYWYNEAKDSYIFNSMPDGKTENDRKFGWMPLPGVIFNDDESDLVTKVTLMDQADCFMMINAKYVNNDAEKIALAKEFLKFLNTEESLREFTVLSGTTKALKYTLKPEDKNLLNSYAKSVWDMRENADIVYMCDGNDIFVNNQPNFTVNNGGTFWQTTTSSGTNQYVAAILGQDGVSARAYFEGMEITSTVWQNLYGTWLA